MCGVIGIFADKPVAGDLYASLVAIQHRGQDSAGIGTFDGRFNIHKGNGLASQVFSPVILQTLTGCSGIGQVRYPTIGGGHANDAQPILVTSPYGIAIVHNGNVTNYNTLKEELFRKSRRLLTTKNDVEAILNVFADELHHLDGDGFSPEHVFQAVQGVFRRVKGAYSCIAIIAGKGMVAFRDPFGIRPLVMGKRGNDIAFASESVALDFTDFKIDRDVKPGEAIFIDFAHHVHSKVVMEQSHSPCIFEYVYFARPDSLMDDISVYKSRLRMGKELGKLWRQSGLEADVVIPVPDASRPAALAFAEETGIKYRDGFVKNRYVGRTFIMPNQHQRVRGVREKLNPIELEIRGKRIIVVDDSIVRGTTSRQISRMLRNSGAEKVYFLITAPPIISPCFYGIDMQTSSEFVAKGRTFDEIAKIIEADAIIYQSKEGMVQSCQEGNPRISRFCAACFDEHYPTGDITPEIMANIEEERRCKPSS
ncbi:MAG: amidophosphoribosyltransferase [Nanoarchaeota archaeon]